MSDPTKPRKPKDGVIRFPPDLVKYMLGKGKIVDLYVEHGGLPTPISPAHFDLCWDLVSQYQTKYPITGWPSHWKVAHEFMFRLLQEITSNPIGRKSLPESGKGRGSDENPSIPQLEGRNKELLAQLNTMNDRVALLEGKKRDESDPVFLILRGTALKLHSRLDDIESSLNAKAANLDSRVVSSVQELSDSITTTTQSSLRNELNLSLDAKLAPVYNHLLRSGTTQFDTKSDAVKLKESALSRKTLDADFATILTAQGTKGLNDALDVKLKPVYDQLSRAMAQINTKLDGLKTTKDSFQHQDSDLTTTITGVIGNGLNTALDAKLKPVCDQLSRAAEELYDHKSIVESHPMDDDASGPTNVLLSITTKLENVEEDLKNRFDDMSVQLRSITANSPSQPPSSQPAFSQPASSVETNFTVVSQKEADKLIGALDRYIKLDPEEDDVRRQHAIRMLFCLRRCPVDYLAAADTIAHFYALLTPSGMSAPKERDFRMLIELAEVAVRHANQASDNWRDDDDGW